MSCYPAAGIRPPHSKGHGATFLPINCRQPSPKSPLIPPRAMCSPLSREPPRPAKRYSMQAFRRPHRSAAMPAAISRSLMMATRAFKMSLKVLASPTPLIRLKTCCAEMTDTITYPGWYGSAYFPPPCTWGFAASFDPFACTWGFDVGLYWGGIGWFGRPFHERWWRDHPGEHWGWHRWWGPGGFVHSHEMRDHLVDASDGALRDRARGQALAARMPGTDRRGPGWNNLYARDGKVRRNIPADRIRTFTPARTASGARDNVFAGRDGSVFRRSNNGWEQRGTARGGWTGMNRVPEAHPSYRPPLTPVPRRRGLRRCQGYLLRWQASRPEPRL